MIGRESWNRREFEEGSKQRLGCGRRKKQGMPWGSLAGSEQDWENRVRYFGKSDEEEDRKEWREGERRKDEMRRDCRSGLGENLGWSMTGLGEDLGKSGTGPEQGGTGTLRMSDCLKGWGWTRTQGGTGTL